MAIRSKVILNITFKVDAYILEKDKNLQKFINNLVCDLEVRLNMEWGFIQ